MLRRRGVLFAVLALLVALAAYDFAQAVTVRCQRTADKNSIVMVDELDALPGSPEFVLAATRAGHAAWSAGSIVQMSRGSQLTVRGTAARAWYAYDRPAVFAEVDGRARVPAERRGGPDFRIVIPSRLLEAGPHRVTFAVVNSDLSGYFVPPTDLRVNVLR